MSFHRALNFSESYFSHLEGERVALDNQSLRTLPGGGLNPQEIGAVKITVPVSTVLTHTMKAPCSVLFAEAAPAPDMGSPVKKAASECARMSQGRRQGFVSNGAELPCPSANQISLCPNLSLFIMCIFLNTLNPFME